MTKVWYRQDYLNSISGNIQDMNNEEFAKLFNIVAFEKARREMAPLRATCNYTLEWDFIVEGKPDNGAILPTQIEFRRASVQEWFQV